jgi:predicted translin family RNA/ssDNA-binding protein
MSVSALPGGEMSDNKLNFTALSKSYEPRRTDIGQQIDGIMEDIVGIADEADIHPDNPHNRFRMMQRSYSAAHTLRNAVNSYAKEAALAMRQDRRDDARQSIHQAQAKYNELCGLVMPEDEQWGFTSDAGQELIEMVLYVDLYPCIFDGQQPIRIDTPDDRCVTEQAWLAGIQDVVGELYRAVNGMTIRWRMPLEHEEVLRTRFSELMEQLYIFAESYESMYPRVINNTRQRHFAQTYRGKLGGVRQIIDKNNDILSTLRHSIDGLVRMEALVARHEAAAERQERALEAMEERAELQLDRMDDLVIRQETAVARMIEVRIPIASADENEGTRSIREYGAG